MSVSFSVAFVARTPNTSYTSSKYSYLENNELSCLMHSNPFFSNCHEHLSFCPVFLAKFYLSSDWLVLLRHAGVYTE